VRDAGTYLRETTAEAFDLIVLDPPYQKDQADLAASPLLPELARLLAPGGCLVWEHHARNAWSATGTLALRKTARYGETALTYLGHPV
jgi:16S rRNA G966 N2-methylase RsmD